MSDTLSSWEADALQWKKDMGCDENGFFSAPNCDRLLVLIELVRKKDNEFRRIRNRTQASIIKVIAEDALALTEELK